MSLPSSLSLRLAFAGAAVAVLAACGGADDPSSTTGSSAAGSSASASTSDSSTSASTTESSSGGDAAASGTVSANEASVEELESAFEAAGIDNAAKWAHEVEEYRPYDTDDTSFTHLREELAKYNPSDGVVDDIVSTLTLP
jgi:ABC-type glycerol-3-phosphate transport system substrate-binding protein